MGELSNGVGHMVDRDARDKLIGIIHDYLEERITAFTFDEQINELAPKTEDETVKYAVRMLWYHYDDCKDHKVVLCKEQWDYFQRLLLLLKSDASVLVERLRIWSWHQVVAGLLLACFVAVAIWLGWGAHLFLAAIPMGVGSIALSHFREGVYPQDRQQLARLTPFASFSQVLEIRRTLIGFNKHPHRAALAQRRIRSPGMDRVLHWQFLVLWVLFSPAVLFFQMFPLPDERVSVRM